MKLSWLAKRRKFGPSWEHRVNGVVWRLVPAPFHRLICEERDLESKVTTFFCLDQFTGRSLWKDVSFDEKWWIGIEGISEGVLFLHLFATPDLPIHKGIIALDADLGRTLWMSKDLTFHSVQGRRLKVSGGNGGGEHTLEVDARSGEPLPAAGALDASESTAGPDPEVHYSKPLDQIADPRPLSLLRKLEGRRRKAVSAEVVNGRPFVVYSCLEETADPQERRNTLVVADEERNEEVYSDSIQSIARTSVPEPVFVRDGSLYYIRERRTIASVPLPGWKAA